MITHTGPISPVRAIRNGLNLAADTLDPLRNGGETHEVRLPGYLVAELLRDAANTYADLEDRTGPGDSPEDILQATAHDPAVQVANIVLDGVVIHS